MRRRLQVFVSSTFTDLIEERQAAVSAILKAGHIPAGMELFTAGDKSQLHTINRWIDESDAYMLILGGRYGSIEPVSGVSYTELEYDYALQQGKPAFAVVIKDELLDSKLKTHGMNIIERENPKLLKLFRDKVLSNISSFFGDSKDIKLCVYESLSDIAESNKTKGWVRADDVEDTKSLHEEINRLKEENSQLRIKFENTQKQIINNKKPDNNPLKEIARLLADIEIEIPSHLSSNSKTSKMNLLDILMANKEYLINGVTNSAQSSDSEIFFYSNVCPKLMVHGLVSNEKIAGVRYRRSFVNTKGLSLLSEVEKIYNSKKSKEPSSSK